MKKFKKFLAMALSTLVFATCSAGLIGCGGKVPGGASSDSGTGGTGGGSEQTIDNTKTQVKVKYNNGGLRREWLDTVLAKFEEVYANVSFEEGKKGVQIQKDFAKENIVLAKMSNSDAQVLLLEDIDVYDFGVKGALLDITDVVKSPAKTGYTEKESVTIESKMSDTYKTVYNVATKDHPEGGYYAIPFFETPMNLNYSVDLFEQKGLYFKKSGSFIDSNGAATTPFPEYGATADDFSAADFNDHGKVQNLFVNDATEARSAGPDGKYGTVDDGLPATYADFKALLIQMETVGVTAFTWNSIETGYLTSLINGVWANNVGKDQMMLSLTFEGEAKNIADLDANGNLQYNADGSVKVKDVTINGDNADLIHLQTGKLDALKFAEIMTSKDAEGGFRFDEDAVTSQSQYDAQNMFIDYETNNDGKPVGFLIDGEWWLSESKDANFKTIDSMHSARYGILPLPRATRAEVGTATTNVCDHYSSMFINSNCATKYPERLAAAKELLSFLQNEGSLLTFTYYTNMFRALNYEISDERLDKLGYFSSNSKHEFGYFTKNVYETRIAPANSSLIPWQPVSDKTRTKATMLAYREWGFSAMLDGTKQINPVLALKYYEGDISVDTYFLSIYKYWAAKI